MSVALVNARTNISPAVSISLNQLQRQLSTVPATAPWCSSVLGATARPLLRASWRTMG